MASQYLSKTRLPKPNLGLFSLPAICFGLFVAQPADLQAASAAAAGGTPATDIDLSDSALTTSFSGVLESVADGPVGTIEVRVSRMGRFSARIQGAGLRASGRGTIDGVSGEGTGEVRIGWGQTMPLELQVNDSGVTPGTFYLEGEILDGSGSATYTFIAAPAAYTNRQTPPEAGNYTMGLLGATMTVGTPPTGDGAATARITRGGRVSIRGYHSDGTRFNSRATILEGNCFVFYTALGRDGIAIGELILQNVPDMSDFDGSVIYQKSYTGRGAYPGGYSFTTNAVGNLWSPGMDVRTAMGLDNGVNNAVLRLTDGPFDGQDAITTVDIRGRITVPRTQTLNVSGRVGVRDGMVSVNYQYKDPDSAYVVSNRARVYAVVLPKMGETRGNYLAGNGGGAVEIISNDAGTLPPMTVVSPRVKAMSEIGGGYQIQITASEPWTIEIPEEVASWVSVNVTEGDADAVVSILVSRNTGFGRRDAYLLVAGQLHVVVQQGSSNPSNEITINPEVKTIGILGGNYFVAINASNPQSIPDTGFLSVVDWVQVLPFRNPVTGELEGANVVVQPPTGDISVSDPTAILRTAEVLIGGVRHTVNQIFAEVVDPDA